MNELLEVTLIIILKFTLILGTNIFLILLYVKFFAEVQPDWYTEFIVATKEGGVFIMFFCSYLCALMILFWLPRLTISAFYKAAKGEKNGRANESNGTNKR